MAAATCKKMLGRKSPPNGEVLFERATNKQPQPGDVSIDAMGFDRQNHG